MRRSGSASHYEYPLKQCETVDMDIPAFPTQLFGTALQPGSVALVGAGPGDPGLLTLRGWSLLQQADAVVYDRLVADEIIEMLPQDCERHYVGKRSGHHSLPQDQINLLLLGLAHRGRRVVRLKGGDPFIFGRGAEELDLLLRHGIPCQVIPGITAASGCTTYAGIPLTHRDLAQACVFVTGHLQNDGRLDLDWAALASDRHTLVFYMGLGNLEEIARRLMENGLCATTPAALISHGTQQSQQVLRGELRTLPQLATQHRFDPPTLIVIGKVVALFDEAMLANFRQPITVQSIGKVGLCA
ncbi:Siroheme synthase [compost metagenome]